MTNSSPDVAMGVGMPIAVLMQMLVIGFFAVTSFTMGRADRYAEAANARGIDFLLLATIGLRGVMYSIIAFITVYFGEAAAKWIAENAPTTLLEGLGLGARIVPAIGFAMLLKIMWSKEMAGVFFIGFVMTTYLKLPIMAVAIIGASIAALYFYFSGNGNNNKPQAQEFEDGI